jgi:hypothetical protein
VAKIYSLKAQNAIQFDLDKTKLIHFTKAKATESTSLKLLDGQEIQLKEVIKWLGM